MITGDLLFLEDRNGVSGRLAVIEDDGTSVWLYLSEAESRAPIADVWVYNRIPAPPREAIGAYRGGPPPAPEGYAGEAALCDDPWAASWAFGWSRDGQSVAIFRNGEAVALIVAGEKRGYSRELVRDGPWGHPWSEGLFRLTFDAA